ncbi:hypothetical protein DLJ49_08325 [Rhodovulum sp. 12E13]|uniref:hypothetical protein n=1 Tax=Rhodovulum sp. 12E13 TaxID=2203891 RepID=UPI000E17E222|nr:hypothetical protein [Rhodovulum sp. 12E13]RDC73106.1 hypothetical protein DLJ49_08325 [Rhodovulum sp. 12E13]
MHPDFEQRRAFSRETWSRVVVLLLILAAYVGWPNATYTEAEDSILMSSRIVSGTPAFHPNHLLFEPLYHALLQLFAGVWPQVRPELMLQGFTTVFALVGLAAAYLLILPRAGTTAGLLGVGLIAASYGYWHYGKVVDAYVPALSMALVSLVFLDRYLATRRPLFAVLLALAAASAVLIHQLYVFHAALLFVFLLRAGDRRMQGLRDAMLYAFVAGAAILGAYWLSYLTVVGDDTQGLAGLFDWAKGHARDGLWLEPSLRTPFFAAVGIATGIVFIAPVFVIPGLAGLAEGPMVNRVVVEEVFVAHEVLGPLASVALVVLAIIASVLCLALLIASLRGHRKAPVDPIELYLLVFVLLYAVLATVWEALNREFWIHVLAALALFVAMRLRGPEGASRKRVALAAVLMLGVHNFFAAIVPFSDPANDYWSVRTSSVAGRIAPHDTIVVNCTWLCARYLERKTGSRVYLYSQLDGIQPPAGIPHWRDEISFELIHPETFARRGE